MKGMVCVLAVVAGAVFGCGGDEPPPEPAPQPPTEPPPPQPVVAEPEPPPEPALDPGELPEACKAWKACINTMEENVRVMALDAFFAWEQAVHSMPPEQMPQVAKGCTDAHQALIKSGACK